MIYGYIHLINSNYSEAETILLQAEEELEEEKQANETNLNILKRLAYLGDILGRIFMATGHYQKALFKMMKTI